MKVTSNPMPPPLGVGMRCELLALGTSVSPKRPPHRATAHAPALPANKDAAYIGTMESGIWLRGFSNYSPAAHDIDFRRDTRIKRTGSVSKILCGAEVTEPFMLVEAHDLLCFYRQDKPHPLAQA